MINSSLKAVHREMVQQGFYSSAYALLQYMRGNKSYRHLAKLALIPYQFKYSGGLHV